MRGLTAAIKARAPRGTPLYNNVSKDAASKWLKYQYGVLPTLYEVQGLSDLIHRKVVSGYIYGSLSQRIRDENYVSVDSLGSHVGRYYVIRKNNFRYRVDSQGLKALSESGITNPALVVWELVPYSFVFDWFIGVGDYLSTLDALVGVTDLRVNRSQMMLDKRTSTWTPSLGGTYVELRKPAFYVVRKDTKRNPTASTLNPKFPSYDPHVSTKRMVSSLALIRNLFK